MVSLPLPAGWRSSVAALPARTRLVATGVIIGILVIAAPVIYGRIVRQFGEGDLIPSSFLYRIELWRELFLPAIAQQPIFGVALTIPDDFGWNTAESLYLQWLFQGGIVGTIGWLILVGTVFVTLRGAVRETAHWLPRAALAGLIALLVMGVVNAFLLLSVSSEVFWWLVGGAVALQRLPNLGRQGQQVT
jgi:O-antigen ligase